VRRRETHREDRRFAAGTSTPVERVGEDHCVARVPEQVEEFVGSHPLPPGVAFERRGDERRDEENEGDPDGTQPVVVEAATAHTPATRSGLFAVVVGSATPRLPNTLLRRPATTLV
jgi:hypothetical protein